jgi:hypothetical protein
MGRTGRRVGDCVCTPLRVFLYRQADLEGQCTARLVSFGGSESKSSPGYIRRSVMHPPAHAPAHAAQNARQTKIAPLRKSQITSTRHMLFGVVMSISPSWTDQCQSYSSPEPVDCHPHTARLRRSLFHLPAACLAATVWVCAEGIRVDSRDQVDQHRREGCSRVKEKHGDLKVAEVARPLEKNESCVAYLLDSGQVPPMAKSARLGLSCKTAVSGAVVEA